MRWLERFSGWLRADPGPARATGADLQFAMAALLLEVAWADHRIDDAEMAAASAFIRSHFDLDDDAVRRLVADARQHVADAAGMQSHTRLLTECLDPQQRIDLVRQLWMLALADGVIDPLEEHRIRGVADLLYVSHRDFIAAKLQARAARAADHDAGPR